MSKAITETVYAGDTQSTRRHSTIIAVDTDSECKPQRWLSQFLFRSGVTG